MSLAHVENAWISRFWPSARYILEAEDKIIAPNGELLSTGKLQGHAIAVIPNDFNWVPYTSDAPNGFKTFTPAAQK
jgi:hypothetical protein